MNKLTTPGAMHTGDNHSFRSLLVSIVAVQVLAIHIQTVRGAEQQTPTVVINQGIPLFTTDPTPVINGSTDAPEDSRVTVTIDRTTQTAKVLPGGSWTVDWQNPLPPGEYRIVVSITDTTGNTATTSQTLSVGGPGRIPRRPLAVAPEQFEPVPPEESASEDFAAVTNRWRIVPPPYELNVKGSLWDPYNQNVLKGDYPVYGQDVFLDLTSTSD